MRSTRLTFFSLLLTALIVAYGGAVHQSPPPAAVAPSEIAVAAPPAVTASVSSADVLTAYHMLLDRYVEPPAPSALLTSAWFGARSAALRAGASVLGETPPVFDGSPLTNEAAFSDAFARLFNASQGRTTGSSLVYGAIDNMARSLRDNHTGFLPPDAFRSYQTGESVNFGYTSVRDPGGLLIWEVLANTPAARAGIRPGDIVVAVNDRPVSGQGRIDQPEANVSVRFRIDRLGQGLIDLQAAPEFSQRPALVTRMLDGRIAYVRLYRFPSPAATSGSALTFIGQFDAALAELESQSPNGWVLDLRGNAGGTEQTAAYVAGRLGYSGRLIENVSRGGRTTLIQATGRSSVSGRPLVVVVDQSSASSSEITAAAFQDSGGEVVGLKTAGLVNTSQAFDVAGGGLLITVARVYAGPKRRLLDGAGVTPNELVPLDHAALRAGYDSQLDAAVAYLVGRTAGVSPPPAPVLRP